MDRKTVSYLKKRGMINPLRNINLINKAIEFNKLNLKGLTVFTEAASNNYIYTPIIAAMAGAEKVYAITGDSQYGTKEGVKKNTSLFAQLCGVKEKISIVFDKSNINEADIVTNLGFVRPIDKETIDRMKKGAVISYMCEAWEMRPGDVDIEYCRHKSIKVIGTNEHYPGLDVFNFSGLLALKMLFDAGIEVYKSKIVIAGNDAFGNVIYNILSKLANEISLLYNLEEKNYEALKNADALIIADYTSKKSFIGKKDSYISAKELRKLSNFITVIQFAGSVDIEDLRESNINYYPNYRVGNFRMGRTLAYLGPKPVIDLHCAGLKVGEMAIKGESDKLISGEPFQNINSNLELCQYI